MSDQPKKVKKLKLNGSILAEFKSLHNVVSSLAEAETVGIFYNAQVAIPILYLLEYLNNHQPPIHAHYF